MADGIIGWGFGVFCGILLMILIVHTSPIWFEKNEVIVWTNSDGVVCHKIDKYPQINCDLLKEAIGERKQPNDELQIDD